MKDNTRVFIHLSAPILASLDKYTTEFGLNRSEVIRRAILEFMRKEENK